MLRISNHYISKVVFSLLFLEVLILIGSFYAGAGLRFFDGDEFVLPKLDHFFMSACVFAAAIVFSMSALGMYQVNVNEGLRNPFFLQLMPSFAMGFCILTLVFYVAPDLYFGRGILLLVFCIAGTGIVLARVVFLKTAELSILESRILFIGCGQLAKECGELAARSMTYHKYHVAGYVAVPSEDVAVPQDSLLQVADGRSLVQLAQQHRVSEIVVSVQNRRGGTFPIKELLDCKLYGISVTDSTTFFERETCQIRVDSVQPSWLVFGGGFDQGWVRTFMKRSFDVVVSLLLLVVSLPVMLLTALAIYIEDRAPIFYSQERVGKDGQVFRVLKFRSMYTNAEQGGQPQWAAKNDPRITYVGNIIRKLRIDELPQILNVLKGQMSFVGPRPERPYFVGQLTERVPYYNVRHSIKPGITGWAQVRYGYGDSVEDAVQKLQYDLYYVKNNSLLLDVLVLIDTFKVVMFRGGR
ncbi:sugar transferase (PEP-CTERM system associated)/exopolysaccharide biosynthesis polyprenyl glycosylphosphotransferase [Pseudoduganella flava]|uniref:Sugar transferase (PEP-CTERM system associated)/exopolysaccharide biosynthesis polyprenyl glycosylphosphotransferase n=1 Tax=Pseudoduganella flava TaxID=871742 RepID=A0A562PNL1_9BURK|nr:TIGR03013 family XrtA/PEP-CTERM system glycosyltransferase [Pseudoduganella flava]QGZ40561.1 TIGR03013 family PEP-CTERM/XrtA system glycosyltransferase [Pseudoduganella flava]TWI46007.1 sugar transferase (PEP-CTERM system associated)/exopolysaccharide biosynthesis polyprenyl glycosylphosphotransferase [Pseudoduganella flava]